MEVVGDILTVFGDSMVLLTVGGDTMLFLEELGEIVFLLGEGRVLKDPSDFAGP